MPLRMIAAPVLVLMLVAALIAGCGGGASSMGPSNTLQQLPPSPTPSPSPTPTPATLFATEGSVLGVAGQFSPPFGDTASGGSGDPVDGITCDPTMSNNYHVHVWVGVYVNGTHDAMPYAVGMKNPGTPSKGFVNSATCFYHIHTHDSSGIIHVEDPNPTDAPITATLYTLKSVFDIWGITVNSSQVGPFSGPVRVYTSGQVYRGDSNGGLVSASTYTRWSGDPDTIPLYSHEVIFLEVGPTYPAQLPNVSFYTEF